MGREIRRVPLDFNWPLNQVWEGYIMPDRLSENPCPDCKNGYSPQAQNLYDLWYGYLPFDPASTGSKPWRHDSPAVRAFAERNISNAPDYYGTSENAIIREGTRLANLWNGMWSHHLTQDDVNALLTAGRLRDLTHAWSEETRKLEKIEPPVALTAEQVNEWSLCGFGHDGINTSVVIRARCEREGVGDTCPTCEGHASIEKYEGQRAEAEAWEATDPPEGDGWQLWETVSEGSPISPAFPSAEDLARWMSSPAYTWGAVKTDADRPTYETTLRFVMDGWAPTLVASPQAGIMSGVEWVGTQGD